METGQPFSDGDFLKNCMMETAVILCPENKVQSKSVSLSPSNLPNLLSFASILSVSAALCSNVHPDRKCHPRLSPDQNSQTTERHKHQQQYSALYWPLICIPFCASTLDTDYFPILHCPSVIDRHWGSWISSQGCQRCRIESRGHEVWAHLMTRGVRMGKLKMVCDLIC